MALGIPYGWQVENSSGTPVSGAKVYTYRRATTTPQTAYTDSAISVPAANPIIADAAGWFNSYLNPALDYTVVIKSADDSITYQTRDYFASTGSGSGGNAYTVVDTLAELRLIEGDDSEDTALMLGRGAAGDGGAGQFRWVTGDQSANVTADTASGIWVAPTSAPTGASGAWQRIVEGDYFVDWFGTSADWGAAATAAIAALPSRGVVRFRPGGDYTLNTQVSSSTKNFFKIDISGCALRLRNTTGAAFKFGTGAVDVQDIAVVGDHACYIDGGTTAEHPLFELRGVQRFYTHGLRGDGIYEICDWGNPSDSSPCYEWWNSSCALNQRSNAAGGHSYGIQADGSEGGYYETDCFFEGDADNVAGAVPFFVLTSAQGPARFDGFTRSGGNWKYYDNGISVTNARIVNVDTDPSSRMDDMQSWAVYILCESAATKGGVEQLNLQGHFGGSNASGAVYIRDEKGTVGFDDISITNIDTSNHTDAIVQITTSGSGAIRNVLIGHLGISDFDPASSSKRVVELDGDITLAVVDDVVVRHKTGASNTAEYIIYNNTASTKRVKIGANIVWDAVGTAVIYDPNIGDLSIGRFCALRPDGSPRGGPVHLGPFSINNVAASVTNGDIGIRNDTLAALSVAAFDRCRIIGLTASLLGTPAAGNLTISANPNASGADANLQVAFSSADGGNPRKRVLYPAGTAAIAAAGSIRLLYTTDGSWSPTTCELVVYQIVQEM
jgi:hypothetical protein